MSLAARAVPRRVPKVLLVPAVLAALVAALPLVYLAVRALERGPAPVLEQLSSPRTFHLAARSLGLAATVTAACTVVGVSVAWLTTRVSTPMARTVAVVAALPLAVPSYVAAYAWLAAVPKMPPFAGSVLVLTSVSYPYVLLPVAAALHRTDPALEEVARALGRSRLQTFWSVTLRQVRPATAAGALLVALYALSDFGAVALMRFDSFTRVIYTSYTASFDRTPAAILSLVLVALTTLIVLGENVSRGRAAQARLGAGVARQQAIHRQGSWATVASVGWLTLVAAVAVGFPVVSLAYWVFRGRSAGIDVGQLTQAAAITVGVALLGALVTTVLALPVGVIAARYRGRVGALLEQATYAGHALPGVVVALAMVFLSVRLAYPLYQSVPLLVLAYAVLFLPAAVGSVRSAVTQSPPALEDVARSLGRRPSQVLREVTLPLAGPGVAAGAALVFLTCMKELPATLLLRPTGMDTLATRLWTETSVGAYAAAAPYAALLLVLAAVPAALLGVRRTRALAPAPLGTGTGEGPEATAKAAPWRASRAGVR